MQLIYTVIRTWGILAACSVLFVSVGWAEDAAVAEHSVPSERETSWLSRSVRESPSGRADSDYRSATWRSMGVLALLVGVLVGAQYLIRKRIPAYARPTASLRVVGRLRVGVRQEVVLVEWEGEQLALGVGSSFIRCLHVRPIGTGEPERKSGI